jgi:hypothetical protein
MSRSALPGALEWIGPDTLGFLLMHNVVRGIPKLLTPNPFLLMWEKTLFISLKLLNTKFTTAFNLFVKRVMN